MDNNDVYYMLKYNYVSDIEERRPPFNLAHWNHLLQFREEGIIERGGRLNNGTGAIFIIKYNKNNEKSHPEYIGKNDPFYINKLMTFEFNDFSDGSVDFLKNKISSTKI